MAHVSVWRESLRVSSPLRKTKQIVSVQRKLEMTANINPSAQRDLPIPICRPLTANKIVHNTKQPASDRGRRCDDRTVCCKFYGAIETYRRLYNNKLIACCNSLVNIGVHCNLRHNTLRSSLLKVTQCTCLGQQKPSGKSYRVLWHSLATSVCKRSTAITFWICVRLLLFACVR